MDGAPPGLAPVSRAEDLALRPNGGPGSETVPIRPTRGERGWGDPAKGDELSPGDKGLSANLAPAGISRTRVRSGH